MRSYIVAAGLVAVVTANTYTSTVTEDVTITSCGPTVTNCPYKSTSTDGVAWGEWDSAATSTVTGKMSDPTASSSDDWSDWSDPSASGSASTKVVVSGTSSTTDSWVWGDWDTATTATATTATATTATGTAATKTPAKATTPAAVTSGNGACPTYTATAPPDWFSLLPTSVLSSIAAKWTGGPPADWCYYTYSTGSLSTSAKATVSSSPYWPVGATTTAPAASGTGASGTVSGPIGKWTGAANSNTGSVAIAGLAGLAAMLLA